MATRFEYRPGPRHHREREDYIDLANHMNENPGVWVKVRETPTPGAAAVAAYQIRTGVRKAFRPAGAYDAYSTGTEVIARYTGKED